MKILGGFSLDAIVRGGLGSNVWCVCVDVFWLVVVRLRLDWGWVVNADDPNIDAEGYSVLRLRLV